MKDLGFEKLKSSVYNYIRNNCLPAVLTVCKECIYDYPYHKVNKTIWNKKLFSGERVDFAKLAKIENYFNTKLLIKRQASPCLEIIREESFMYRYKRLQLLNSKYKARCQSKSDLTYEKLKLFFEAYYAQNNYATKAHEIIDKYGHVKICDLYSKKGIDIASDSI